MPTPSPTPRDAAARSRMIRQRRRDTSPELRIRRALHGRGLRYRVDAALPLTGVRRRADMLFTARRVAVFVDGCYWHGCPVHATQPKVNADWWAQKLAANIRRDRDTDHRLVEVGWTVVRIWEHEETEVAVARVLAAMVGADGLRSLEAVSGSESPGDPPP